MRVRSTQRQRRWNNYLILGIVAFIVLLNGPKLIQSYLLDDTQPEAEVSSTHPKLLDPSHAIEALYFKHAEFQSKNGEWQSNLNLSKQALSELMERWRMLEGTLVEPEMFEAMKGALGMPETIEVWYVGIEEPQRITVYQGEQFWLMQNWQQQWIAISFDLDYLIP